ncbi:MAG: ubiquitin-like domain-containing protein [Ruminococcus sp.]|nr:ubiquitin-like domain-containing protein [Ruminococcus sp.]
MKQKPKASKAFSIMLAVLSVLMIGVILAGATLSAAGSDKTADTAALFTSDILAQAGVTLSTDDEVIRVDSDGAVSLTIIRAFDVEVVYRGKSFNVKCTGGSVSEAIKSAGITLSGAEAVTPDLDSEVTAGTVIEIVADSYVILTADGETREIATKAKTVGEFLAEAGVTLSKHDILNVDKEDEIYDNIDITVQRVEYKEEVRTEYIDYDFVTEETDDMYLGVTSIERYGVEGEKEVTYKCKYIDGELVDEEYISEKITVEPVDQLELVGTYVEPEYEEPEYDYDYDFDYTPPASGGAGTFTDHNGNQVAYTNVLTGSATAYYAAEGAYTATGVPVHVGGVAVNPNIIPYGAKLYIVSSDGSVVYGYATAVDTGGALMSGEALVDVFYPTYNECVNWGRRNVTVYILG